MKKFILPILIIIAFVVAVPSVSLAKKGHGHYNHHGGHYYKNRSSFSANFFYGPAYYPRPYVYYAPPPPVVYAPPPVYYGPSYYPPVTGSFNFGILID